jgi:RNA polymerase primary sigma factor
MRKKFDSNASKNYYTPMEGVLGTYIGELYHCEILKDDEIRRLIKLAQNGDKKAEEKIVKSHLKFTLTIGKRFSNGDYDLLCDLVGEANVGLLESIEKFDLNYPNKFITFSKDWMLKRVYEYLSFKNDLIKISNKHKHTKVKDINNKFYLENGRNADILEIYDLMDDDTVNEINIVGIDSTYLSDNYNEKNDDYEHFDISSFNKNEFEIDVENDYFKAIIDSSIGILTPKEQEVVKMLYGIDCFIPMETQMVADSIGLTYEAVRNINKRALHKLKSKIEKEIIMF